MRNSVSVRVCVSAGRPLPACDHVQSFSSSVETSFGHDGDGCSEYKLLLHSKNGHSDGFKRCDIIAAMIEVYLRYVTSMLFWK